MPKEMTPRQRVRRTLNHQEPDRVPISLGGSANHLTEELYIKIRDHFEVEDIPRRTLVGFYTTPDYNPILEKLETDFRFIHMRPPENYIANTMVGDFVEFVDEWGLRHRLVGGYYDLAGAPLADDLTISGIRNFHWPDPYDPARLEGLQGEAEDLFHNTDYALVAHRPVYGNLWEMAKVLAGMENALLLTVQDHDVFDHLIGKLAEVQMGFYDAFLSVVGPYVEIVEVADDYGTNVGPMFNPNIYREFFMPRYKELIRLIKEKAPRAKVLMHNDGAIRQFIPDLIETGFEVLNPIEGHLKGMHPASLKADFGDELTFQGGVDVKTVLNHGTVEDVREEVKLRIAQMGPGGGYILAPAHNFGKDIPLKNLLAFFEAGKALGAYPIEREPA
jgi:uroporphyrinogen decarboxylase